MTIIAFILAIIGCLQFLSGKHVGFLIILVLLAFDFFGIFGTNDYSTDAMVIMNLFILGKQVITGKHPFTIKRDPVGKSILLLLLWVIIRYVASTLLQEETAMYGLKVLRNDFFIVSYFVLRQINFESYSKFFKVLIPITIVLGFVGLIYSIINGFDGFVYERKTIIALSMPLLFALVTKDILPRFHVLLIALFVVFIAMTLARGIFLATCVSIAFYYLFVKKVSVSVILLVIPVVVVLLFLFSSMENSKSEGGSESITQELSEAKDLGSYDSFQGGSFLLRFALTWERGDYLINHPNALIFGVGTIHEDSPNNNFTFGIGSYKTTDDFRSKQMIDTEDVALITHWLRYGSVYLILFFWFLKVSFKKAWQLRDFKYMLPLLMLLISMCISMVSVDFFSRANRFIIALIMLSMTYQHSSISTHRYIGVCK